jgi:hypothetical protein
MTCVRADLLLFVCKMPLTIDHPVYVFGSQGSNVRALSLHCRGDYLPGPDSPARMLIAIVPLTLEALSTHSDDPALALINLKTRGFFVGLAKPDQITFPQPHRYSA